MTAGFAITNEGTPPRWGDQLAALSDERIDSLPQDARLGSELSFGQVVQPIKVMRDLALALARQDPVHEPAALAPQVTEHLNAVIGHVDLIEAFTATDNPEVRRVNTINNIENERSWFVQSVQPFIRADAVGASAAFAELNARRDEVTKAAEEAQAALVTIREAAGEKGTSDLARFFEDQAKGHKGSADRMLLGVAIAVGVLFAVGAALVFVPGLQIKPTSDLTQYLREVLPRLFLLGIIAYVIRFFGRNYTINKHLQVSNEQRANILRTFPTLIASGQTEVQKDRMAVIIAQAAMSAIDSGYLKHPEDKGIESAILAARELSR